MPWVIKWVFKPVIGEAQTDEGGGKEFITNSRGEVDDDW